MTAIRFHLDEHISSAVAVALRQRGIDVTTTTESGLESASDEEHLRFAHIESRVIVTSDYDFLRLHQSGVEHAGIAFTHQGRRRLGEIVRSLQLLYDCLDAKAMKNHIEFL